MLYNPPGSARPVRSRFPADKNEAVIPLTANGSAAIGTWPIVVTGRRPVGNGSVEVASQMADLEIADSFFDFAFEKSAPNWARRRELRVSVENEEEFEGEAEVRVAGPAGQDVDRRRAAEDSPRTPASWCSRSRSRPDARPGSYKSLVCRAIVTHERRTDRSHAGHAANCGSTSRCRPKRTRPKPSRNRNRPQPSLQPQARKTTQPPGTVATGRRRRRLEQTNR